MSFEVLCSHSFQHCLDHRHLVNVLLQLWGLLANVDDHVVGLEPRGSTGSLTTSTSFPESETPAHPRCSAVVRCWHSFVWCQPHSLDALLNLFRHWHTDNVFHMRPKLRVSGCVAGLDTDLQQRAHPTSLASTTSDHAPRSVSPITPTSTTSQLRATKRESHRPCR